MTAVVKAERACCTVGSADGNTTFALTATEVAGLLTKVWQGDHAHHVRPQGRSEHSLISFVAVTP